MATFGCNLLVVCQGVSIDKQSGSTTLFSIYDQTTATGFPLLAKAFVIYFVLNRDMVDPESERAKIKIVMEFDGKKMSDGEVELSFSGKLRSRNRSTVDGLVLPKPGQLKISLYFGERILNSYQIDYRLVEKAKITAAPSTPG